MMVEGTIQPWDLVLTEDGYYGIVTSLERRAVYLSNGCEELMSNEAWAKLRRLPMNVFQERSAANFIGLTNSLLVENRCAS